VTKPIITGYSMVSLPITRPGVYSSGIPTEEAGVWRRIVGRIKRIDSWPRASQRWNGKTNIRGRCCGGAKRMNDPIQLDILKDFLSSLPHQYPFFCSSTECSSAEQGRASVR